MPRRDQAAKPQTIELGGVRYAVVREDWLRSVCCKAGVTLAGGPPTADESIEVDLDAERLGERLAQRRKRAGLTQAELARRAGVRVETLCRVERGRTTPDFSTVRKLVVAINAIEQEIQA